jgi:hypothetical protein
VKRTFSVIHVTDTMEDTVKEECLGIDQYKIAKDMGIYLRFMGRSRPLFLGRCHKGAKMRPRFKCSNSARKKVILLKRWKSRQKSIGNWPLKKVKIKTIVRTQVWKKSISSTFYGKDNVFGKKSDFCASRRGTTMGVVFSIKRLANP